MKLFQSKAGSVKSNALNARVKVLGSGCKKCNELEQNVKLALVELGMEPVVEHITDFSKIATYNVMSMPALVVDNKVVSYGKVLTVNQAKECIQNATGE
ncbi:thioredoxin family protein [Tannockella kyphosi]|uniref:thioredoxin family protein n=1 Tax=Tannockella kyphosi TaxID=2899121 RepID=UPI002012DBA7|nr:thioredoxin family protein [Tannockella kyphosi]